MRRKHALLVLTATVALGGCGAFDSGTLWQSGPFRISWVDSPWEVRLGYEVGGGSSLRILDPCVFAVGENRRHLVVKQLAPGASEPVLYVLDKDGYALAHGPESALSGPLTEQAFALQAGILGLPVAKELFPASRCRGSGPNNSFKPPAQSLRDRSAA